MRFNQSVRILIRQPSYFPAGRQVNLFHWCLFSFLENNSHIPKLHILNTITGVPFGRVIAKQKMSAKHRGSFIKNSEIWEPAIVELSFHVTWILNKTSKVSLPV